VTSNVADEAQVAAMVERTVATFGKLDMAFNNAGILGPVGDLTDETASFVLGVALPVDGGFTAH
jgi:NAD(P)-dependent dehydrogenase (short-subunit alcohol dehydrogenase family)